MFGLLDKETPETARRLFETAKDVADRYLALTMAKLGERVAVDIPESMRFVSRDEVNFSFADLPGFSFMIINMGARPTLTVFGSGPFSGFMLQRSAATGDWMTDVSKPAAFRIGAKAHRLSTIFQRRYGVSHLGEMKRRLGL